MVMNDLEYELCRVFASATPRERAILGRKLNDHHNNPGPCVVCGSITFAGGIQVDDSLSGVDRVVLYRACERCWNSHGPEDIRECIEERLSIELEGCGR